MKNIESLKVMVLDYVNFVKAQETEKMSRFYNVSSEIRVVFPDSSARDIAEKIGVQGFGKSNVALGLKLVRDFPTCPKMTLHDYNTHASRLSKIDADKRLDVAEEITSAKGDKAKVEEIYTRFGLGKGGNSTSDTTSNPTEFKLTEKHCRDFAARAKKDGMIEALILALEEIAPEESAIALKNAKKAIKAKAKALAKAA